MTKRSNLMDAIRAAAEAGAIRSTLGRWFISHHGEFSETLERFRPRWETLVEKFAEERLIQPPADFWSEDTTLRKAARRKAVDAARKTWLRVDARAKVQAKAKVPAPAARPPGWPQPFGTPLPLAGSVAPEPVQDDEPEFTTIRGNKV